MNRRGTHSFGAIGRVSYFYNNALKCVDQCTIRAASYAKALGPQGVEPGASRLA